MRVRVDALRGCPVNLFLRIFMFVALCSWELILLLRIVEYTRNLLLSSARSPAATVRLPTALGAARPSIATSVRIRRVLVGATAFATLSRYPVVLVDRMSNARDIRPVAPTSHRPEVDVSLAAKLRRRTAVGLARRSSVPLPRAAVGSRTRPTPRRRGRMARSPLARHSPRHAAYERHPGACRLGTMTLSARGRGPAALTRRPTA